MTATQSERARQERVTAAQDKLRAMIRDTYRIELDVRTDTALTDLVDHFERLGLLERY